DADLIAKINEATAQHRQYGGGLLRRTQIVSTAWESARAAAITNDMPFPMLMTLGRAYGMQADYLRVIGSFYDSLLAGERGDVRGNPELLIGLYQEFDGFARRLDENYDQALKALPAS